MSSARTEATIRDMALSIYLQLPFADRSLGWTPSPDTSCDPCGALRDALVSPEARHCTRALLTPRRSDPWQSLAIRWQVRCSQHLAKSLWQSLLPEQFPKVSEASHGFTPG